jgi:uncharacterized protein YggU (UPF0235/DUF167 family)
MKKIWIQVKPNKSQIKVKDRQNLPVIKKAGLEVWLTATEEQGKANQQLVAVLAKHWHIATNKIVLLKGETSQYKLVAINN